ncbi:hypothetical protein N7486_005943 [Penicillium sp. IBT 16267x]|nr:hypothetical protein N7486_005943 [Penicillium sp. IBT 16267x]
MPPLVPEKLTTQTGALLFCSFCLVRGLPAPQAQRPGGRLSAMFFARQFAVQGSAAKGPQRTDVFNTPQPRTPGEQINVPANFQQRMSPVVLAGTERPLTLGEGSET